MTEERWEDCRRCHFRVGVFITSEQRDRLYREHWVTCPVVETLTYHPDGTLASVTFRW